MEITTNSIRRIVLLMLLCLPASMGVFAKAGQDPILDEIIEYHKLGSQPYPFHDATVWNNDVYAVQKYMGQCRLIRFKHDENGKLQFKGYKTINSNSATHRDMSLIVWYGKLYIFWNDAESNQNIYYTYVDFNSEGDDGETLKNLVVHSHYKVADESGNTNTVKTRCSGYLETVVFQGKLILAVGIEKENNIQLRPCVTVPDDKNKGKLVFSQSDIYVKNSQGSVVNLFAANSRCIWDMTVWRGNVNGKPGEKLIIGLVHEKKKLKVYSWAGYKANSKGELTSDTHPWESISESREVEIGEGYSLKMVQGALATTETYTDNNLNSLLFIYSHPKTDNIQVIRYLPEKGEFYGKPINTGVDDGYMGVVANYVPDPSGYTESKYVPYRMYIHVIAAWEVENNLCMTLTGNWARVTCDHVPISLSMVKKMPSLRQLIKLQYVLEGMPPTPIVKETDFNSAVDQLGYISSIVIGKHNEDISTLEWELDFKAVATIGYQKDEDDDSNHASFSFGGHGNFQEVETKSVSKSVSKKLNLVNIEDLNKGWAYYSEPILDLNWISLYSPNNPKMQVPKYPEELRIGISDYVLAEYPFDLSIINVDGTNYNSWNQRLYGDSFINTKSVFSSAPVIGYPTENETEYTSSTSKFQSSTAGFIFGADLSMLVGDHLHLGFNFDLNYDHTQTQTTTNADVYTVNYPAYRTSDSNFLSEVNPKAFNTSLYALHYQYDTNNANLSDSKISKDMDGDASDSQLAFDYYKMLEKNYVTNAAGDAMQIRVADEFPIILAWRAGSNEPSNIKTCSIGSNLIEIEDDNEDTRWFSITPKNSGTLIAKIKDIGKGNRIILREGLDIIRKYAVSRYDELTGETTVSLQITAGEPIYIGFILLQKLAEKREWTLSLNGSGSIEDTYNTSFDVRAANGNLYVNWPSETTDTLDVTIYALNGQELYHGTNVAGEPISLADQHKGICIATVSDGKVTYSKRFVIQ